MKPTPAISKTVRSTALGRLRSLRRAVSGLLRLLPFAAVVLIGADAPAAGTNAPPRAAGEAALLEQLAARGTNTTLLYQLGDVCHDAGVRGDKKAVERAETYLRQLLALEPTNAPALALLGSVYTMKGRDAFWPNVQIRLVHEGNAFMDQAIRLDPENLRARLTRAFNNAHMPEFLGRTEIVRADLAWLSERAAKDPGRFSVGERQELALHLGRQLHRQHRNDEARRIWEQGRALSPDSRLATEITTELGHNR